MKKDFIIISIITGIITLAILGLVFGGIDGLRLNSASIIQPKEQETEEDVRQAVASGEFYPAEHEKLEETINNLLDNVESSGNDKGIFGLILPHASYEYSGQVMAYGFKELVNKDIDTVILIGNSHQEKFDGISIFPRGSYKTPLGNVAIDSSLVEKLFQESERIFFQKSAHEKEYSLEVQIPFLQVILKDFKILPIVFGNSNNNDYSILAKAISKNIKGKNVLIIASSDLSHYPSHEIAQEIDKKVIDAIITGKVENLEQVIRELEEQKIPQVETLACGIDAIKTVLQIAQEAGIEDIRLLNYANSGDVSEEQNRTIGYGAIGFFDESKREYLNQEEQNTLLEIARRSVETHVKNEILTEFEIDYALLKKNQDAFVTIKKQDKLRGCVGSFSQNSTPLYKIVGEMAIAAATKDQRFEPIQENELNELKYEISVLSQCTKINDWSEIKLGIHGVRLAAQGHSGVFLPQVATENNWDVERFLGELCFQKAGLPWNCWKEEETELCVFTAQVFSEE